MLFDIEGRFVPQKLFLDFVINLRRLKFPANNEKKMIAKSQKPTNIDKNLIHKYNI